MGAALGLGTASIPPGLGRLLHGPFGRDDAWVVIPSVVAAAALLLSRRRRPRTDALRAATLLWSGWSVLTWVFFSEGRYLNSYYLAALIPALAALCGLGAATAWRHRHAVATRLVVLLTVVASTAYALTLVPAAAGVRPWIIASVVIVAALAVGILGASLRRRHASLWTITCGLGLAAVALVSSSAWASGSVVVAGEGPFDTPYQSPKITYLSQGVPGPRPRRGMAAAGPLRRRLPAHRWRPTSSSRPTSPARTSSPPGTSSYRSGVSPARSPHRHCPSSSTTSPRDGSSPPPAAVAPRSHNPDIIWVIEHCAKQATGATTYTFQGTTMQRYVCRCAPEGRDAEPRGATRTRPAHATVGGSAAGPAGSR